MTEEDEAFNDIERQAKQRKEAVRAAINKEKPMNNTPAFPHEYFDKQLNQTRVMEGMTLRDYFAAHLMQGICAGSPSMVWANKRLAEEAYDLADAMLKAREA